MKTQLNVREGNKKEGFRIIMRFGTMKEAREFLKDYVRVCQAYQPTADPYVFYNPNTDTQIWISRQFTPTGDYRYRTPNR